MEIYQELSFTVIIRVLVEFLIIVIYKKSTLKKKHYDSNITNIRMTKNSKIYLKRNQKLKFTKIFSRLI